MHPPSPMTSHPSCAFCGQALTAHQAAGGTTCDRHACRHQAALQAVATRNAKTRADLMASATRHRDRIAARLKLAAAHELTIALVPASTRRSTVLPASRRRQFRNHLETVLASLARTAAPSGATPPPAAHPHNVPCQGEAPVVAAACGACRGHCCHGGGVKAYIDEETLRRFAQANPPLDETATARAYVSHLPRRSMTDSCVFHGEQGCTLPREMRSATCNRYHCEDLRKLVPREGGQVLITAATGVKVVRSTVFENARGPDTPRPATDHPIGLSSEPHS